MNSPAKSAAVALGLLVGFAAAASRADGSSAPAPAPLTSVSAASAPPPSSASPAAPAGASTSSAATTTATNAARIVERARAEVVAQVSYDPSYRRLSYPGGDLDARFGVCTDVVVRALRSVGIDLQRRVHEDILAAPSAYPRVRADANIDHRRVGPLKTWFERHAKRLPKGFEGDARASWRAGDVVAWAFRPCPACSPDHVGVVSDRVGPRGLPLVIHNIGPTPSEDDQLDAWTVLGHFRVGE